MRISRAFIGAAFLFGCATAPEHSVPSPRKEIALTFDDAPVGSTAHFESVARTQELIRKLGELKVPGALIFANACKKDVIQVTNQLKAYQGAGHLIGNHTCSHPRLDDVGYEAFRRDAEKGDTFLTPLFAWQRPAPKFFRFPTLNEGTDPKVRDRMRAWLKERGYRNGRVSIDNDDYLFSAKLNEAKARGKPIDYAAVQRLFVEHVVGAVEYYDRLAGRTLGYSPLHVLLLHEMDATVLFIEPLVQALRARGWRIISAQDAYTAPIYYQEPANTYANNGIIAQLALEKTGERFRYGDSAELKAELDRILGLTKP